MNEPDPWGDLLDYRSDAEYLALKGLYSIFPVLPGWCFHNEKWIEHKAEIEGEPFVVGLSPWKGRGRHFYLHPEHHKTPSVGGWVDVSPEGLWIQPEYFHRSIRGRRQSAVAN